LKKSQPRLATWETHLKALAGALLHANPRVGPRTYLVYVGAFDAHAPQNKKGKIGDQSPWETDRRFADADAESLGDESLHRVYREEHKDKNFQGVRPNGLEHDTDARQDQPGRAHG
jgi:hypothetical protein